MPWWNETKQIILDEIGAIMNEKKKSFIQGSKTNCSMAAAITTLMQDAATSVQGGPAPK